MRTLNDVIIFEDDDEALDFCITQNPVIRTTEDGILYFDYDYTNYYKKALQDGFSFSVDTKNSSLIKHGCLTRGVISKPIDKLININKYDI